MKALSLWQPWASLIAAGVKRFETRSWAPPEMYWPELIGGRLAIHASVRPIPTRAGTVAEFVFAMSAELCAEAERQFGAQWRDALPRGQVLCTARLAGVYRVRDIAGDMWRVGAQIPGSAGIGEFQPTDPYGDFSIGRWIWWLQDVRPLPAPVYAKGHQKLWNWTPAAQEQAA